MKLKNKKTGEMGELYFEPNKEYHFMVATEDPADTMIFKTLARLTEEWEDAPEEQKEDYLDNVITLVEAYSDNDNERYPKWIVEKLKAWKRLKDKGARFKEWFWDANYGTCIIIGDSDEHDYVDDCDEQNKKDLDLLFGGEE